MRLRRTNRSFSFAPFFFSFCTHKKIIHMCLSLQSTDKNLRLTFMQYIFSLALARVGAAAKKPTGNYPFYDATLLIKKAFVFQSNN